MCVCVCVCQSAAEIDQTVAQKEIARVRFADPIRTTRIENANIWDALSSFFLSCLVGE